MRARTEASNSRENSSEKGYVIFLKGFLFSLKSHEIFLKWLLSKEKEVAAHAEAPFLI